MKVYLLAVGTKMPAWVETAVGEYTKRLQGEISLQVIEVPTAKRGKSSAVNKLVEQEGRAILMACPKGTKLVSLDVLGKPFSTKDLAQKLNDWRMDGSDIALVVGGPDGLSSEVLNASAQKLSLSALTLPHPMVRVILAEQIYRAWTITQGHPYHR
jgi:23S rRNA (pseudouridine1915-N3)-methyltransferase